MTLPVIIEIHNTETWFRNLPISAVNFLYEEISYEVPGIYFVREAKPHWDGIIRLFKKTKADPHAGKTMTGLIGKVVGVLREDFNIDQFEIIDKRIKPKRELDLKWNNEKYKLRDYQQDVVDECIKKGRGVIEVATGGGKTIITSKIIQELGVSPFIFYVLTCDLLYQSKQKLEESIPGLKVGLVGDGHCDIRDITIVTVQTAYKVYNKDIQKELSKMDVDEGDIGKLKEEDLSHVVKRKEDIVNLIESAKGIYFDEAHHVAADTCKEILLKSKNAYYLFGGTATPVRSDNADDLIEGLFGRKRGMITASFLIKQGHLIKPEIFFIKLKTKKSIVKTYAEDYKKHIVENEERNNHIISIANTLRDSSVPTLVLVQRIDHGKFLEKMIPGSVFVSGKTKKDKRAATIKDMTDGKIPVMIATTIADEGLDIPILEALINAGGGKSQSKCKQRVGRVLRISPKKEFAMVFDFDDIGKWLAGHAKKRKKILEEEEEFVIKNVDAFDINTNTLF